MNLLEFRKYYAAHRKEIQEELYRRADLEVNGDDRYYEEFGRFIERHPIGPGMLRRGGGCVSADID